MRAGKRSVGTSILYQAGGVATCAGIAFLLLAFLGRTLGPELFGRYVLALSVATILLILIEGGWSNEINRRVVGCSNPSEQRVASVSWAFAQIVVVGVVLLVLATLIGMVVSEFFLLMSAALICMVLVASMNTVSSVWRGLGQFAREALFQTAGRLMSALLIVLLVLYDADTWPGWIFVAWAAGLLLVLLTMGRRWVVLPDFAGWAANVGGVMPLMYLTGALALLFKADIVVLGLLQVPAEALSDYAATTRFVEAALLLFAAVSNVLLREFRLRVSTPAELLASARRWMGVSMLCGALPLAAALFHGEWLVVVAFGPSYADAGTLLPWVAIMLPVALANIVLVQAWIACEQDMPLLRRIGVAVLLLLLAVPVGWSMDALRGVALAIGLVHLCLLLMLSGGLRHAVGQPSRRSMQDAAR